MKQLLIIPVMLVVLAIGVVAPPVNTIDFEGLANEQNVGEFYASQGVHFSSSWAPLTAPYYNYDGYPPHSGNVVIYTGYSNSESITFDCPQMYVTIWGTAGMGTLYMEAYDSGNNLIDSDSLTTNYGSNSMMSASVDGPAITKIVIHDSGNFFTVDDLSYSHYCGGGQNGGDVPEFTIIGAGMIALGGIGYAILRRKK